MDYRRRMGWSFPWASSDDSGFNYDFNVAFTEVQQRSGELQYNFRHDGQASDMPPPAPVVEIAACCGTDVPTFTRERPGMSAFIRDGDAIYHSYSTYARGLDALWGLFQWLDRASLGRNEQGIWWRRHDEY